MIKALASRIPLGGPRVGLALALGGLLPLWAFAQNPATQPAPPATKGETQAKGPATKDEAGKADADKADLARPQGVVDAANARKSVAPEIFKDPRVEKTLPNTFKELPRVAITQSDIEAVRAMAAGGAIDPGVLDKYVQHYAAELSRKSYIGAMLEPGQPPAPGLKEAKVKENLQKNAAISAQARQLGEATDVLLDRIADARTARNQAFLRAYASSAAKVLPKLLDGHYFSRFQAMIVLGTLGSPDLFDDVYIKQLNDPDQIVWVKDWAARGITNAAEGGQVTIETRRASSAAKALSDFLEREADAPWPVQVRALEALGSLRQSTSINSARAEMATTALRLLADPKSRPEVRAWAAWSLGMLRVGPPIQKFNFSLIAYQAGLIAAELGERSAQERSEKSASDNPDLARYYGCLLLYQVLPAFDGDPDLRESGLARNPTAQGDRTFITALQKLIQAEAIAEIHLTQATRSQVVKSKQELEAKVAELRAFLEKNQPKDYALIPGGPEFRVAKAQGAGDGRAQ